MADMVDQAQEQEEAILDLRLANLRKAAGPRATGACLNCDESLAREERWCDADCRADWAKRELK